MGFLAIWSLLLRLIYLSWPIVDLTDTVKLTIGQNLGFTYLYVTKWIDH